MRKNSWLFLIVILWGMIMDFALGAATPLYVSPFGNDTTGNGTQGKPYKTITRACEQSQPTLENPVDIIVGAGAYVEFIVLKPYLSLRGGYNLDNWERNNSIYLSIVNAPSQSAGTSVIIMKDQSQLDGLYIQNGYYGVSLDGVEGSIINCVIQNNFLYGIYCIQSSILNIQDNVIQKNGGGIYMFTNRHSLIRRNTIKGNLQMGIFAEGSDLSIESCQIYQQSNIGINMNNSSLELFKTFVTRNTQNGLHLQSTSGRIENCVFGLNNTGVSLKNCNQLTVYYNTIVANRANGLYCDKSSPDIRNTIFANNKNFGLSESANTTGPLHLAFNCFYNNAYGDYVDGGTTITVGAQAINDQLHNGSGFTADNFDGNPKIYAPEQDLYSLSIGSSCIDAAEPLSGITADIYGELRPYDFPGVDNNGLYEDSDVGAIEFKGIFSFDFTSGDDHWQFITIPSVFNAPLGSSSGGHLQIKSSDTFSYGFWDSPQDLIPSTSGKIYKLQFFITTNVTDKTKVPAFRLRTTNVGSQLGYLYVIDSRGNGDSCPTATNPMTYTLYYNPFQGAVIPSDPIPLVLSFDMFHFDGTDQLQAEINLEEVMIEAIDYSAFVDQFTDFASFDFQTGVNGWTPSEAIPPFTLPTSSNNANGLVLTATDSLFNFGFWSGPLIDTTNKQMLRIIAEMGSDVASSSQVPTIRLRLNSGNTQGNCALVITSLGNGNASPSNNQNVTYEMFFEAPAAAMNSGIITSYDLLNFDPSDSASGSIWLKSLRIQSIP